MYHTPKEIKSIDNSEYRIDDLISILKEAKSNGATHFKHYISKDPSWYEDKFIMIKKLTEMEMAKLDLEEAEIRVEELKAKIV